MNEVEITFNNKTDIRTQAQLFMNGALISTCVVDPGKTCTLLAESGQYDIYLKNSNTGWELTHKLDCSAQTITLTQHKGRYVVN
jgi:hypothetical protein